MSRGKRLARTGLRVAVSLGIVVYILVDVNTGDLVRALEGVRLEYVAAALALYVFTQGLSAYKWSLLGRSVGLVRPFGQYVRFYFIGMFFNLFGVGTIGGDLARALYLSGGRSRGVAIHSVLFDRVSGLALLMALGAAALVAFPGYHFPWLLWVATVFGGTALLVGWWTSPWIVRVLPVPAFIRRQVEHDLAPFWRDSRLLLRVAAVSLVFHVLQCGVQWTLARAAGTALPFSYCLNMHPLLSVMLALPVSLGGFGVREGGYLYFLTRLDIDDSIAVTMGLLWFAVTVLSGLIGALFFLAEGARLPKLRARPVHAHGRATATGR